MISDCVCIIYADDNNYSDKPFNCHDVRHIPENSGTFSIDAIIVSYIQYIEFT